MCNNKWRRHRSLRKATISKFEIYLSHVVCIVNSVGAEADDEGLETGLHELHEGHTNAIDVNGEGNRVIGKLDEAQIPYGIPANE